MPPTEPPAQKLTSPASLTVDAVLMIAFAAYMYSVLSTHVQSHDPKWIVIWGAISTSLMTALFWLALQMFRVVFRFHRQERAAQRKH